MKAEFFDIFGLIGFTILTIISINIMRGKKLSNLVKWILLLISLAGLIVDGMIVITTYLI